jgi:uncharacterized protein (DUF927 family)
LPPFRVLASVSDRDGSGHALQIEHDTPLGVRVFLIPFREIDTAKRVISRLADRGLRAGKDGVVFTNEDGKKFERHYLIAEFFSGLRPREHRITVNAAGWHVTAAGHSFVLPSGRVFGSQSIVYAKPVSGKRWAASGSLQQWQQEIVARAQGNSRLVFALCVAFAGSLIQIVGNADNGGFNLHGDSSTGKTTTLLAAGSVWGFGSPAGGQIRGFNATPLGLQIAAQESSGTVLLLDELKHDLSPSDLASALYNIANVDDRATAHTQRVEATWATFMLTTAENTIRARLGRFARPGLEPRLTDIEAEVAHGTVFENTHAAASHAEFSNAIKAAAGTYYGTAGPTWVEYLAEGRNTDDVALRARIAAHQTEFINAATPKGADNIVARVLVRAGLLAAAGEMAIEVGILAPMRKGEARAAVLTVIRHCVECH